MIRALVEQMGFPAPFDVAEGVNLFNVFHVPEARGSPFVPDQAQFVEPFGIRSVLGIGGALPPSQAFVVLIFATVPIPKRTAELFRLLGTSIGLALLAARPSPPRMRRAYEYLVHAHEEIGLVEQRKLRDTAGELTHLLTARQRFEALVDNSPDFISIASLDQHPLYLNPAGRRMVGLSPSFDVTATRIIEYHPEELRPHVERVIIPSMLRQGRWSGESVLRHWGGKADIPVSLEAFTICEAGTNRPIALGTVTRDISETRRADEERERLLASAGLARAEAQAANRAKDEFLALLGHELRNPLAPIMTAVALMKMRAAHSRELDVIERQADQLSRLVDDLLDVARIAAGKIELHKKRVEMAMVVERAIEMATPLLERRGQRLTVDVPPEGLRVDADLCRLAQVVSNLLTNASKYSDIGSAIVIAAARAGSQIVLRVRDQGIGIPPDRLEAIFELFVQQPQPEPNVGLGLGLSIVRSLVQAHGGVVYARSEGLGRGSEFVVMLPFMAADHPATPRPLDSERSPRMQAAERCRRVLIVDDNTDAAYMMSAALAACGHDVRVACDGPSALEIARHFKPEVALLDIGLPVMDGYELARRLSDFPGMPGAMRLIAVTGYGHERDRTRASEAGFSAHLVKPVDLTTLLAEVRR
jgi:PAS domain S-box-containing protein